MNDLWLKWFGISTDKIPANATPPELDWANLPTSGWVFALIGGVALAIFGIFFLYRREITTCPTGVRLLLAALRSAILLMLVCVALEPMITYSTQTRIDPLIFVGIDRSTSTDSNDTYADLDTDKPALAAISETAEEARKMLLLLEHPDDAREKEARKKLSLLEETLSKIDVSEEETRKPLEVQEKAIKKVIANAEEVRNMSTEERSAITAKTKAKAEQVRMMTRWEITKAAIERDDYKFVRDLAEHGRVQLIYFAEGAQVVKSMPRQDSSAEPPPVAPEDSPGLVWPNLRIVFAVSVGLVLVLATVGFFTSRAVLALIGVIPLTALFFSATMFYEQNPVEPWGALVFSEEASPEERLEYQQKIHAIKYPKKEEFDPTLVDLDGISNMDTLGKNYSSYATPIRESFRAAAERQVGMIVLIGDGQDNVGDGHERAADIANKRGVPIVSIGVGDTSRDRWIAVTHVGANRKVTPDDEFEIRLSVKSEGLDGEIVTAELYELDGTAIADNTDGDNTDDEKKASDGKTEPEKTADSKPPWSGKTPIATFELTVRSGIALPSGADGPTFKFMHKQETQGEYRYVLRVKTKLPAGTRDLTTLANSKADVTVDKVKARVLLVAGDATWEYRFVQTLLRRDDSVDLKCWLQTMGEMAQEGNDPPLTEFPYTRDELFNKYKFDVIMLFDPSPSDFPIVGSSEDQQAWGELIEEFVDKGRGLFYMPGPKYATKFLTDDRTRGSAKVLPIKFPSSTDDLAEVEAKLITDRHGDEIVLQLLGSQANHPIIRFFPDRRDNVAQWNVMPNVYWMFPMLAPVPGSDILLEGRRNSDDSTIARPLLVAGQYGRGRAVYMGFSGSWRWRGLGEDAELFRKYWQQIVEYLTNKNLVGSVVRGSISLPGRDPTRNFVVDEQIYVVARLDDLDGNPMVQPAVIEAKTGIDGQQPYQTFSLQAMQGDPGAYEGRVTVTRRGTHTITIELPEEMDELEEEKEQQVVTTSFEVELPKAESTGKLNEQLLKRLSRQETREGSESAPKNRYHTIAQLNQVLEHFPDDAEKLSTTPQDPFLLWSTNRLWFLLCLMLTIEWGTRKRFKLL